MIEKSDRKAMPNSEPSAREAESLTLETIRHLNEGNLKEAEPDVKAI